jgi:mono/diheme cytochrome c family protein
MRLLALACLIVIARAPGPTVIARAAGLKQSPDSTRSTRAGVYTAQQAAGGHEIYILSCVSCHTPASHAGPAFAGKWDRHPLSELFGYIRSAMPKSEPGSLSGREYTLVLAYLLKMNGMPAGSVELPADSVALSRIRIDFKTPGDTSLKR